MPHKMTASQEYLEKKKIEHRRYYALHKDEINARRRERHATDRALREKERRYLEQYRERVANQVEPDTRREIIALYNQGYSQREIIAKGYPAYSVNNVVSAYKRRLDFTSEDYQTATTALKAAIAKRPMATIVELVAETKINAPLIRSIVDTHFRYATFNETHKDYSTAEAARAFGITKQTMRTRSKIYGLHWKGFVPDEDASAYDDVYCPEITDRPCNAPEYRRLLFDGYEGFDYAGDAWKRYLELFLKHKKEDHCWTRAERAIAHSRRNCTTKIRTVYSFIEPQKN